MYKIRLGDFILSYKVKQPYVIDCDIFYLLLFTQLVD